MTVVIRLQEESMVLSLTRNKDLSFCWVISKNATGSQFSEWILTSMTYEHQLLKGHSDINGNCLKMTCAAIRAMLPGKNEESLKQLNRSIMDQAIVNLWNACAEALWQKL